MSSNAQPFCPNCFSEKTDGNPVCIKCGYDDRAYRSPAVLPPGTVLNDQYVVGRVLGSPGGFGITYLCWDRRLTTRVAIKEFIPRENAVRDRDGCCVVAHSEKDMVFFCLRTEGRFCPRRGPWPGSTIPTLCGCGPILSSTGPATW